MTRSISGCRPLGDPRFERGGMGVREGKSRQRWGGKKNAKLQIWNFGLIRRYIRGSKSCSCHTNYPPTLPPAHPPYLPTCSWDLRRSRPQYGANSHCAIKLILPRRGNGGVVLLIYWSLSRGSLHVYITAPRLCLFSSSSLLLPWSFFSSSSYLFVVPFTFLLPRPFFVSSTSSFFLVPLPFTVLSSSSCLAPHSLFVFGPCFLRFLVLPSLLHLLILPP